MRLAVRLVGTLVVVSGFGAVVFFPERVNGLALLTFLAFVGTSLALDKTLEKEDRWKK